MEEKRAGRSFYVPTIGTVPDCPGFLVCNPVTDSGSLFRNADPVAGCQNDEKSVLTPRLTPRQANQAFEQGLNLTYWRNGNFEADFVLSREDRHVGIEVKSGRKHDTLAGIKRFTAQFKPHRTLLAGTGGMPIQEFFETPVMDLFQ